MTMNATTQFQFENEISVARDGVYPHAQAGVEQVIDPTGRRTMAASARARLANGGGDFLIDFDHDSENLQKSSVAAGWGTDLRMEGDKLLLTTRWTDIGLEALRNGRFRYVSPVFSRVEQLGGNRVRPIELHSVALTNTPVMRELGPISNRMYMNRVFPLVAGGPSSTGTTPVGEPLTLEYICRAQRDLAQAHAKLFNRTFTDSWENIANRFTVLRALMSVRPEETRLLLNRASDGRPAIGPLRTHDDAATQERFWDAVEKTADSVRDRFHSCHAWDGSAGSEVKWMGAAGYYDALKKLQTRYGQGADRDLIWEKMKEQFPKEWADFILSHAHHQGIV